MTNFAQDTELQTLMRRFVEGKDTSLPAAGKIEGILLERYADTELFEALSVPLASYRPGGGEHLYDEAELAREFQAVLTQAEA